MGEEDADRIAKVLADMPLAIEQAAIHLAEYLTTLLNLLHSRLAAGGYMVVWFDAWQHSRVSPPWWALLTAGRHGIIRDHAWWARWWFRLRETVAPACRSDESYLLALILLLGMAGRVCLRTLNIAQIASI